MDTENGTFTPEKLAAMDDAIQTYLMNEDDKNKKQELPQDDFRSVEGLENAGNPHKLYVFACSRRFFYRLCQWCFFGKWCPNGAQIPRGAIKRYKKR